MKTNGLLLHEKTRKQRPEYNSNFSLRDKILLEKSLAFVPEKDQKGPVSDLFFHELTDNETGAKKKFGQIVGFLGFLLFLATLPVFALLILVNSGRPVFIADAIIGYRGNKIKRYLYRTRSKSDRNELTFIGQFLKTTGLHKLPCFYNILTGSMALVGPQPLAEEESELLNKKFTDFYKRFASRPGLVGLRSEDAWDLDQPKEVLEHSLEKELAYVAYPTLRRDITLIFKRSK